MSELIIKTHDFELAKQRLKEFSQKDQEELKLDPVKTDGRFLGLGDHKVTGYELNNILSIIQQHLIDLNNASNKTIKEFGQVYNALEALDKDYIQAILISINATEKTSERIQATQEQIKKIVDDQRRTLEILKKFKQKLDSYSHLGDIDEIWDSNRMHSSQLSELEMQNEETKKLIQANKELVDAAISNAIEKNDVAVQLLNKKVRYAYLFAGGSLIFALIELLVLLLNVI